MFTKKNSKTTGVRMTNDMRQRAETAALRCGYVDMSDFVRDAVEAHTALCDRVFHSKLASLIEAARDAGAISERVSLRSELTLTDSKIQAILKAADVEALPMTVERNAIARRLAALPLEEQSSIDELAGELGEFRANRIEAPA